MGISPREICGLCGGCLLTAGEEKSGQRSATGAHDPTTTLAEGSYTRLRAHNGQCLLPYSHPSPNTIATAALAGVLNSLF